MIEYTNWDDFANACIAHLMANNPNYDEEEACAFHTELASHLTVMSVNQSTVNLRMRVNVGETRTCAIVVAEQPRADYTGLHGGQLDVR